MVRYVIIILFKKFGAESRSEKILKID